MRIDLLERRVWNDSRERLCVAGHQGLTFFP